jgi:hypothetical protein
MSVRRAACFSGAMMMSAAVSVIAVPAAHADNGEWHSLAYSPATGARGWGYSQSHDTAETLALGYCNQNGGTDCVVAVTADSGCMSLAYRGTNWAGGLGPTSATADADALAHVPDGNLEGICL